MKTKVGKWMKYLSSGIFFIALVLNIKISLDDPFVLMSEAVIAVTTSTTSSGSTQTNTSSNSGVKTKYCRVVGCSGTWRGTADINGCITIFGKKYCNFSANGEVTYTYFGKNENCTGGSDWYDCDACQKDCVPD
jgi:hypothetical protein